MFRFINNKYQGINKVSAVIATTVFLCLLFSTSLFHHIHITEDGKIIEHSHPFPGDEKERDHNQHQHSKYNYLFYQHVTRPDFISVFIFFAFFIIFFYFIFLANQFYQIHHFKLAYQNRAPPA